MRKNIVFFVMVLFIVSLLYMFSRKEFVPIPADEQHTGNSTKEMCLECHAQDKVSPLKKEHPPKDQCFECHKRAKNNL